MTFQREKKKHKRNVPTARKDVFSDDETYDLPSLFIEFGPNSWITRWSGEMTRTKIVPIRVWICVFFFFLFKTDYLREITHF